jgi:hypothetical protein
LPDIQLPKGIQLLEAERIPLDIYLYTTGRNKANHTSTKHTQKGYTIASTSQKKKKKENDEIYHFI